MGCSMFTGMSWLQWLPTGLYMTASVLCICTASGRAWQALAAATRGVLIIAALNCVMALASLWGTERSPGGTTAALVMTLVAFLGWIIGDYSRRYLRGEPGQNRFASAYLATLGAVSAVLDSENFALLIAAWAASSAGLHQLLTFYRGRSAAVVVAHKKFLASRLAEACLVAAALLLYREWGSLDLSNLAAQAAAAPGLSAGANAAATLLAVAVLLKCAQLPLHGWLIQVMEAPTPVSALLHAGVVNLGGYVLVRLAPLISASTTGQTILVIVGSLTAALAGLVMLTRITIKVRLAWSTCSQMGLMVMECGLGLYDIALLHLIAHSLYKAYSFLTAGEAVRSGLESGMITSQRAAAPASFLIATLALGLATLTVVASSAGWQLAFDAPRLPWINTALLAVGLATLLWSAATAHRGYVRALALTAAAAQLYLGWHWLISETLSVRSLGSPFILQIWAFVTFIALYYTQAALFGRLSSAIPRGLYDWVYAGFYLDERFTRLIFRLWPPTIPTDGEERLGHPEPNRSRA